MTWTTPKSPCSLYDLSISIFTKHYKCYENEISILPGSVLFDVYYSMYNNGMSADLCVQLLNIDIFGKILKVTKKRIQLLQLFQSLMQNDILRIADSLRQAYVDKCQRALEEQCLSESTISLGLRLGTFLSDAGWFVESKGVLESCLDVCLAADTTPVSLRRTLECYHKLLHANSLYRDLRGAAECFQKALALKEKLQELNELPNLAGLYAEFSAYFFVRFDYDRTFHWASEALKQLTPGLPASIVIFVLRWVSRTCVLKRQYRKAGMMIGQAVALAEQEFDEMDPRYADTLIDYGFFLQNSDNIKLCVDVYIEAVKNKERVFGQVNLYVAFALEELAFALYVAEYTTGHFIEARKIAERTDDLLQKLLPPDHLLHASAKRIKALILEEIVLVSRDENLLPSVEALHLESLRLSMQSFGVWNVQTAKIYGNLGRFYQTMKKYKSSEKMHLKSIHIKEHLLGVNDYEVGLSLGHLASLYNYHFGEYQKAEQLYLRSIEISENLFGLSYTGLNYDYRGLLNVYAKLENFEKLAEYTLKFEQWKTQRERIVQGDFLKIVPEKPLPLSDIINSFLSN